MSKVLFVFALVLLTLNNLFAFEVSKNNVIVKGDTSHIVEIASSDLSFYLDNILGAKITIVSKSKSNKSEIILQKLQTHTMKEDSFKIEVKKDKLYIKAENERGLLFGVYHFLDHYLGCKFLAPDFDFIPHFNTKTIDEVVDTQEPAFVYRELFYKESDDPVFAFKLLLNGRLGHRTVFDEAETTYTSGIKSYSYTSSELLGDQYECNGQHQYNNPLAQKKAFSSLTKELASLKDDKDIYVTLEHEDRGSYCEDGLKKGERPSKTFLTYVEYLAKAAHKKYNKMYFYYQAYLWSRKPPRIVKRLPSYLGVNFAGIEANFAKPLLSNENKEIWHDLQNWGTFSDDIVIWHYTINFGGYMYPFPNLYALAKDIENFAKLDFVKGVFLQGSYETFGGDLAPLRVWVFSKLLWNPKQDIDFLISEFCHYYYGKAADDVVRYIHTIHDLLDKSGDKLTVKTSIDSSYLSTKNLNNLDSILTKGLSKLKQNSPYWKHYQALFTGIDYIRLIRGEAFPHKKRVKKRFKQYLQNNPQITAFSEGVKIDNVLKILNIDRTKEHIPSILKKLRRNHDWFSFQEYQMELCCADIVEDPKASDGVSAVMDGSSNEWGFSLPLRNLPKGKWTVYADVRIVKNKSNGVLDKAKLALKYGIYPTFTKGIALIGQFGSGYKRIKIGTIDTNNSNAESVWLSPPGNTAVQKVYVDRIYYVRE